MRRLGLFLAGIMVWATPALHAHTVGLIDVDGAIGPATATYISRAIQVAADQGDQCLILRLNTPGGLLDSTREIVQSFYAAPVPVVVYVAPEGANAGSAGCFITLAAHVATMAPHTSIGAAHPVAAGREMDDVMKEKLVSFAASYIEAIAEKRGRNVDWAISAVRESASATAETALELDVIEIIATDLTDLLEQLHGLEVDSFVLNTEGAGIYEIPMTARERVFQMLWRPEVMFLLMLIAIYGIIGELSNPGAIIPGVVGVIALVLALYMGAVLPINVAGLALIVLAMGLFIAEAFTPTTGVLTGGGIIAFLFGALMLFDRVPAFHLSLAVIIPATLLTAAFFVFVVSAGLRAQLLPVRAGRETLIGRKTDALTGINETTGKVFVEGEYWHATSEERIEPGEPVEIVQVKGLTLKVRKLTGAQ